VIKQPILRIMWKKSSKKLWYVLLPLFSIFLLWIIFNPLYVLENFGKNQGNSLTNKYSLSLLHNYLLNGYIYECDDLKLIGFKNPSNKVIPYTSGDKKKNIFFEIKSHEIIWLRYPAFYDLEEIGFQADASKYNALLILKCENFQY